MLGTPETVKANFLNFTLLQLSVHYPYDIPHVTDFGMAMRPNYEHFVSVLPDVTQADDVIRTYSIVSSIN